MIVAGGPSTAIRSAAATRDVLAQPVLLVRPVAEDARRRRSRQIGDQVGVGDPGAVEAVAGLAVLVGLDLLEGDLVDLGVARGRG